MVDYSHSAAATVFSRGNSRDLAKLAVEASLASEAALNSDVITTSAGTEMRQISETEGIWDLNQTV